MKIRKAELNDLKSIIDIFKNAIDVMNEGNIPQWDEIYPTSAIFKQDILKQQMYVGIENDDIVSVIVVNDEFDELYKKGDWKYKNRKFVVIHRLCVNPIYQKQGIGKTTMLMIEALLKKREIQSIRLDAFSLNPYALKLYKALGYRKVGEVNFRKGVFYLLEKEII
ncbi:MAG: GNAT family N-acetyltransferase [Clostridium sp.]|nr:GNAT family N-acetyltransferase [Clostridium sp.]